MRWSGADTWVCLLLNRSLDKNLAIPGSYHSTDSCRKAAGAWGNGDECELTYFKPQQRRYESGIPTPALCCTRNSGVQSERREYSRQKCNDTVASESDHRIGIGWGACPFFHTVATRKRLHPFPGDRCHQRIYHQDETADRRLWIPYAQHVSYVPCC